MDYQYFSYRVQIYITIIELVFYKKYYFGIFFTIYYLHEDKKLYAFSRFEKKKMYKFFSIYNRRKHIVIKIYFDIQFSIDLNILRSRVFTNRMPVGI